MPTNPQLLSSIAAHVDKHLLMPMLTFAADNAPSADLKQQYTSALAKVQCLTAMGTAADDEKRAELEKVFARSLAAVGPLQEMYFTNTEETGLRLKLIGREFTDALRQGKFGAGELRSKGIKSRNVKALYDAAFMLVDTGSYDQAADALKVYVAIMRESTEGEAFDTPQRASSAEWGLFLCDSLLGRADASKSDLEQLLAQLDERAFDQSNQARVDLLHWSLFHYFKRRDTAGLLDLIFLYDRSSREKTHIYANAIQCLAPHLLRYVAIAAVLNKKKKATLFRASRLIESSDNYSDVFTSFLVELNVKTDFAKASQLLAECDKELANDYFGVDLREEFIANARQMLFEDQLRVRKSLSIATAAQQLGMQQQEAELWLVDLIREAKLEATVDSVAGLVRVNAVLSQKSVWQYVMDRLDQAVGSKQPAAPA